MAEKPYRLVSRQAKLDGSIVSVGKLKIGGKKLVLMAGPCAVESEQQLLGAAKAVKEAGASVLRASAYKPRSSPYSFQGLEEEGLKLIKGIGKEVGLATETEVIDTRDVKIVSEYVDILRVGARNMQNFSLLKEVGKSGKPVILKNGISATLNEFLLAAEYILNEGNENLILCYRGIRTFEPAVRFPLDVAMVALLKEETHLPVIVDPSHSTGKASLVGPVSKAALAAGADGLMVEVHPEPEMAFSDKSQQLTPGEFKELVPELKKLAKSLGRDL